LLFGKRLELLAWMSRRLKG